VLADGVPALPPVRAILDHVDPVAPLTSDS
jgi:hypothetical protein